MNRCQKSCPVGYIYCKNTKECQPDYYGDSCSGGMLMFPGMGGPSWMGGPMMPGAGGFDPMTGMPTTREKMYTMLPHMFMTNVTSSSVDVSSIDDYIFIVNR